MKKLKEYKIPLILSLLGLLILTSFLTPLPYYVEMPGESTDIRQVLTVNNEPDKESGQYQFVTVAVAKANLPLLIYAWLTPFTDIQSDQDTTGGASQEEFQRMNYFFMESSQNLAKYQGLKTAGKEIEMVYEGVYVLSVADDSTFKGILNIGDTVTGVDDKSFQSSADLIKYVGNHQIGDKVSVTYQEDGQEKKADGKIIKLANGKNGIGITLTDKTSVKSDTSIDFKTQGIGGPSAGLMFSLDIYTQLADPSLRKGRTIAGTGTIDRDGKVGDIGGIDKKVLAAHKAGASIFFAPDNPVTDEMKKVDPKAKSNYQVAKEAAKKIGTDMKIVPVKTLDQAIQYLKENE